ncbi:MAG: GntR family transcriptional regulator [Paracoccus sp. BP8]|uniref:GntR family transcriptional regulator n=1 Tax=unclassified Paracoccus (in: a-proteobacteria) TaxID=2688777 RepID=UPI000225F043|nr:MULTISPECIES: GntR family transcriptional regulator [unclassified Paracoccus (in: a-proteobacteria)]RQP08141.1 MAG: GntR family transcriptional regulator [Paracoccus sp. BP8]
MTGRTKDQPRQKGRSIQRPGRLGDEVYETLYAQLMALEIPPGARISVDNLVRELGVSQTPIREALSRLEAQGLVVKTHLIGYSAASQIDEQRLEQLYDLRLLLEPYAAGRAAVHMDDEDIARLVALDARMDEIHPDGKESYGEFAAADGQFHDLIAQGSGNELVRDALSRLYTHVHLFRLFYLASVTAEANDEHAAIVAAIVARDSAAAEEAMRRHVLESRKRFTGRR